MGLSNVERFPNNVFPPKKQEILGSEYTVYGFHFKGLHDFYEFLSKNPDVNYKVFTRGHLSSVNGSKDFAGRPYNEALENLTKTIDPGYQEYLRIQKNMKSRIGSTHKYRGLKTVAGGNVDPVAYTVGSPEIYRASRLVKRPKFITLDTQISYSAGTSKKQVFNRAVIITSIIHALERAGYSVDVNCFMVDELDDEVISAVWEVKRQGHRMNYQTLYKSLVDVEFLRRLCFRITEVADVENDWSEGYGRPCGKSFVRDFLKLRKEDIYFDTPNELRIYGKNIVEDFENTVYSLDLEDVIDVKSEKNNIERSVKVLER